VALPAAMFKHEEVVTRPKTLAVQNDFTASRKPTESAPAQQMSAATLESITRDWLSRNPGLYNSEFNRTSMRNFRQKNINENRLTSSVEMLDVALEWITKNNHLEKVPGKPRKRGEVVSNAAPMLFQYDPPEVQVAREEGRIRLKSENARTLRIKTSCWRNSEKKRGVSAACSTVSKPARSIIKMKPQPQLDRWFDIEGWADTQTKPDISMDDGKRYIYSGTGDKSRLSSYKEVPKAKEFQEQFNAEGCHAFGSSDPEFPFSEYAANALHEWLRDLPYSRRNLELDWAALDLGKLTPIESFPEPLRALPRPLVAAPAVAAPSEAEQKHLDKLRDDPTLSDVQRRSRDTNLRRAAAASRVPIRKHDPDDPRKGGTNQRVLVG
jgi:hypothetical protein